jgi:hypothetical protein
MFFKTYLDKSFNVIKMQLDFSLFDLVCRHLKDKFVTDI